MMTVLFFAHTCSVIYSPTNSITVFHWPTGGGDMTWYAAMHQQRQLRKRLQAMEIMPDLKQSQSLCSLEVGNKHLIFGLVFNSVQVSSVVLLQLLRAWIALHRHTTVYLEGWALSYCGNTWRRRRSLQCTGSITRFNVRYWQNGHIPHSLQAKTCSIQEKLPVYHARH